MIQIAISFNITSGSFFKDKEITSSNLIVIIEGIKININSNNILEKQKFQIVPNATKEFENVENQEVSPAYYYDSESLYIKEINNFKEEELNSFIKLRPKIHLKDIISLQDCILFLKAKNYIRIEQELDATNELFLDKTIPIRIQSILELLKII